MADFTFNSGHTGTTTIAQVGYGEGSVFSKNGALTVATTVANAGITAFMNQANHNTTQILAHFNGGIQLQLGEGGGDQNRTVLGMRNMSISNLGRIELTGSFTPGNPVVESRVFSLQDLLGGQAASLSADPSLAIRIISTAIDNVSSTRAQIGAMQSNMLQTNENNLRIALENITKTESDIRDTDMASEMTELTRNQILNQAGLAMMFQANQAAENVLTLL
jgi:flagellin-like hook-associated protein FlgL